MSVIFVYGVMINLYGFLLMWRDKRKARKRKWRVPEKIMWLVTVAGGAVGIFMGMHLFRHKTKHYHFQIGVPLLILLQLASVLYLLLS